MSPDSGWGKVIVLVLIALIPVFAIHLWPASNQISVTVVVIEREETVRDLAKHHPKISPRLKTTKLR